MLPGHRATHLDAGAQQILVRGLRALELLGLTVVVQDERVEVAVPGMEHVGDLDAVPRADRDQLAHDRRKLRARDDGVLEEIGRRESSDRSRGFLSALPEERALGDVGGDADLERPALPADPRRALALRLDLGGRAVQLDQEDGGGVLGIAGAGPLVDRADHQLVEHLERRRDDAGRDDRRDRFRGVLDRRERGQDRLHGFGGVKEADRDRRDDAERPLRAHGRTQEVVARPLNPLAPQADQLARPGHQLEPEDVVRRDPVLQAVGPAGVGRDVAADRRDHLARRIGREEISAVCDGSGEREVDQAGLDRRAAIGEVDFQDRVHSIGADHHAAGGGHGAPDQPGARTPGHDGDALAPAQLHDLDDLIGASGQSDRVRGALVKGVHVALVDEATFERTHEPGGADDALELLEKEAAQGHVERPMGRTTRSSRCLPTSGAWRCRRARAPRSPSALARA